mmetsp:Transcript_156284/g.291602  ORF Transcript_156284/g.291602 Transcript_156284/m.291602 type:complete len:229 (+) Transcript_156284:22-708(+)
MRGSYGNLLIAVVAIMPCVASSSSISTGTDTEEVNLLQLKLETEKRKGGKTNQTSALKRQPPENLYGQPLIECDPSGYAAGSSNAYGQCDEKTGGIHSLCVSDLPADFSEVTGQGTWTEDEAGKPWCVCIGAWSLYKAEGHTALAHCAAIPSFVLDKDYIDNWSTWNGNELDDQIVDGITELYDQCSAQAQDDIQLANFKSYYCRIATQYVGKTKSFSETPEYTAAGC